MSHPEEITHGIVPALDVASLDQARRLVEATTDIDGVVGYKIGPQAVLRLGLVEVVRLLRNVTPKKLIYDHQKAGLDIPSNAAGFAAATAEAGVDGVILFPIAGPDTVRAFVRSAVEHDLAAIIGAALPLADFPISGGGWVSDNVLAEVATHAVHHNATGIVVPATDPAWVAALTGQLAQLSNDLTFYLPGIGALGGSISTALREVSGPRAHAIVGRSVHAADDPAEAARQLAGEALRATQRI